MYCRPVFVDNMQTTINWRYIFNLHTVTEEWSYTVNIKTIYIQFLDYKLILVKTSPFFGWTPQEGNGYIIGVGLVTYVNSPE